MLYYETDYLAHHGVKGQKWGRRKQIIRKGRPAGTKKTARSDRLFGGVKESARRRAFTKSGQLKSTKRIVAETIGIDALIGVGSGIASNFLASEGHKSLANCAQYVGVGVGAVNTAVGITSAVQRGRGRYKKGK